MDVPKAIQYLAEIMVLDKEGEIPLEDLTDDGNEPLKSWRDSVVQRIREKKEEHIALRLRLGWMPWMDFLSWATRENESHQKIHVFSSADLLPICEDSPDDRDVDKNSDIMNSQIKMADIAREWLYDSPELIGNKDKYT